MGCYNSWANLRCSSCSPLGEKIFVKWDYYAQGSGFSFKCAADLRLRNGQVLPISFRVVTLSLGVIIGLVSWRRHQMETYSALLAICAGNSLTTGEFPAQRPVTRSFGVFFDLSLNKRLSKHSWGWWFKTPTRSLWRHCNAAPAKQLWQNMGTYILYQYLLMTTI